MSKLFATDGQSISQDPSASRDGGGAQWSIFSWKFQPLLPSGASSSQMKQPTSAVAYKRPISQYARVAMAMGVPPQVRAEDILFLASDVSPPVVFEVEFSHDQEQDPCALHMERLMQLDSLWERPSTSKVRKSRSGCQSILCWLLASFI
uniref:Uncharacterized protein n=1 Tax=Bos indicus x Bos taurus TaxID=30522 RepID=A0A4W2DAH2_BOBOX